LPEWGADTTLAMTGTHGPDTSMNVISMNSDFFISNGPARNGTSLEINQEREKFNRRRILSPFAVCDQA